MRGKSMELLACLLMLPTYLQLDGWHMDPHNAQISVRLSSKQPAPACPQCHRPTHRIHSQYQRTLADLPWNTYRVSWELQVRKCFCEHADCPQRIFCERFVELISPWARKTSRLLAHLTAIGLALAGAAGARLSTHLNLEASRETLLGLVRRLSPPVFDTPRVLGVDDWAFRRGRNYGTLLVDLELAQPIALLPDREASTLAEWLEAHPGVEIITRDRSLAYKQGTSEGAPKAVQVADRFHLLDNLASALEKTFRDYPRELKAVEETVIQQEQLRLGAQVELAIVPPPPPEPTDVLHAQQSRSQRLANYERTWELHQQGWTHAAIAQQLGISVKSVYRFLKSSTFPERQARKDWGRSQLDPYKPYLLERWNRGFRQAKRLYEEIKARGYQHSYNLVARFLRSLKQVHRQSASPAIQWLDSALLPLTPKRAAWLVLGRAEKRDEEATQLLSCLQQHCAIFNEAITLSQAFAQMLREQTAAGFDEWLKRVIEGNLSALATFAQGLQEDYDAVKAGLTLPWSNGPVEGQINRLKMLKRQMYGRANLDLLGQRFILAS